VISFEPSTAAVPGRCPASGCRSSPVAVIRSHRVDHRASRDKGLGVDRRPGPE
jgi:hypothetical protein